MLPSEGNYDTSKHTFRIVAGTYRHDDFTGTEYEAIEHAQALLRGINAYRVDVKREHDGWPLYLVFADRVITV